MHTHDENLQIAARGIDVPGLNYVVLFPGNLLTVGSSLRIPQKLRTVRSLIPINGRTRKSAQILILKFRGIRDKGDGIPKRRPNT